jgi:hypothetical protein
MAKSKPACPISSSAVVVRRILVAGALEELPDP